jgi:hypothetical protein
MLPNDIDKRALDAIEGSGPTPQDNLIHLSTGVVLRGKQAPPLTLMNVMAAFPRPKPPLWMSPAMGREMENPDDPNYIEAVRAWQTDQSNALMVAMIITGTELVEVPKGMAGPDDKDWIDEYALLGLPMHRENKSWCYLRWVQTKAAISADDVQAIMKVVGRLSGIPERAVESAEAFPGSNTPAR